LKIIGVDLGIRKIAWAVWDGDILVETMAYESQRTLRHEQLVDLQTIFMSSAIHHHQPDHVFIEDTLIGNNRKFSIQLSQTMGAVLAGLGLVSQISALTNHPMGVYLVHNTAWKKELLEKGNAGKELVRDYIYSRDSAYAELCGYDQDRFDAACIGYYGVVIANRAVDLTG